MGGVVENGSPGWSSSSLVADAIMEVAHRRVGSTSRSVSEQPADYEFRSKAHRLRFGKAEETQAIELEKGLAEQNHIQMLMLKFASNATQGYIQVTREKPTDTTTQGGSDL